MATVELIKSRKGNFLHVDGFLYYYHSCPKNRVYWNCRNKKECLARIITAVIVNDEDIVILKGIDKSPHTHAPNREEVEAVRLVSAMKRVAEEHPELPPARIIRRELKNVPSEILAEIPERPNVAKLVSRVRLAHLPPNPLSLRDLEGIPNQYRLTLGNSKFLLYDSLEDEDEDEDQDAGHGRILIFGTSENLTQLFKCTTWFIDGTFKTAPSLFFQIFSILGAVHQVGVNRKPQTIGLPFVHALLENKRQSAYTKVLEVVLREGEKLGLDANPRLVMSDFEMGMINAVKDVFGEGIVKCCFFQLCQAVYRHVVSDGLQGLYNSGDRSIKKAVHMLCALAFVPVNKVLQHFQDIRDELPAVLEPVINYFEVTYVRRLKVRRRSRGLRFSNLPARYAPTLWNQYNSVINGSARTNNLSEGWHNRFQLVVGKNHPSLYVFLSELQKEQADTEIMLHQLQLGQRVRKGIDRKRRKYEELLRSVVQNYSEYVDNNDVLSYLRTIGYHIKL